MEPLIFDSHAHYDDERFDTLRDEILFNLGDNNVSAVLHCAIDYPSSLKAIEMADKYDRVFAAVGIHPQEVTDNTVFCEEEFSKLIKHKKVKAIGEIGLDYYWDTTFKENQKEILIKQINFAKNNNLPISFHDREAHKDSLEILKSAKPKGVVHCFSGSKEMAEEILKAGMFIGVGGVVTFKNSKKLCEVVESTPVDRILLETDAPYLAPEPFRGKMNRSEYVEFIAKKVAEIKKLETEEVLKITKQNAESLFGI